MRYLPLCESAKRGYPCIDDLCNGVDTTLCGFEPYEYERMQDAQPDEPEEPFEPEATTKGA